MDGRWTGCGRAGAAEIAWEEARDGRSESECPDPVDGRWTGCGRAGAAEIAWEEASDGGARAPDPVDGRRSECGRAGKIAWEEARDGGARANVRIRWTGWWTGVDGRLQK